MVRLSAIVIVAGLAPLLPNGGTVQPAFAQAVQPAVVGVGYVDAPDGIAQIASPRDGIVQEIKVGEGAVVKKGDVLLVVDDRAARVYRDVVAAEVQQAETAVGVSEVLIAAADREVRRLAPLMNTNVASRQRFDEANDRAQTTKAALADQKAAILTARARLASAETEVERRTIRAPFDGIVVRRLVQLGDGISTLNVTPLFWLAPSEPPIVRVLLEEKVAMSVAVGQVATITLQSEPGKSHRGHVQQVGQTFGKRRETVFETASNLDGRLLECIVAFDDPPARSVLGQRATVAIEVPANSQ